MKKKSLITTVFHIKCIGWYCLGIFPFFLSLYFLSKQWANYRANFPGKILENLSGVCGTSVLAPLASKPCQEFQLRRRNRQSKGSYAELIKNPCCLPLFKLLCSEVKNYAMFCTKALISSIVQLSILKQLDVSKLFCCVTKVKLNNSDFSFFIFAMAATLK